jgi:A/G-specific adenine glycosylase
MRSPDGFVAALLAWGEGRRADLPWRATRDPWAILVSEFMLQQTQVSRVVPRFEAFVAALPTPEACAAAPRAAVVRLWDGLGYNRRAVHLHETARRIVDDHDGTVPATLDELLDLPGVGPYTARAVASLAFGADVGVLDTNAARVLARAVAGRSLARREAQRLADRLVPAGRARDWNQAVMDLGATVCRRSAPRCGDCPVADHCAWTSAGRREPDPADGTAGASRTQPRFEGSDRQGRGRLVALLRDDSLPVAEAAAAAGWPDDPDRARRIVADLIYDGLARIRDDELELPT